MNPFLWSSKRIRQEIARERIAEVNQAYLDGYTAGYESGKFDSIFLKNTPNQIREAFGVSPIQESEETK